MILIRLVIGLRSHDPITPALAQLCWLTVQLCSCALNSTASVIHIEEQWPVVVR